MSDKSHEEEIAKIDNLIEQAAKPGESGAVEGITSDLYNIEVMAREIMRLREELEEATEERANITLRLGEAIKETRNLDPDKPHCRSTLLTHNTQPL